MAFSTAAAVGRSIAEGVSCQAGKNFLQREARCSFLPPTPVQLRCGCGAAAGVARSVAGPRAEMSPSGTEVAESNHAAHSPAHHAGTHSVRRRRHAHVLRKTKETDVEVEINLDGTGIATADSGIDFLDHMLDQLASHGLFDVTVRADGDTHIDDHHSNEDIGLALGQALAEALGDRKGINRFGTFTAPLDEALIHVTLDLSGRPHLSYDLAIPTAHVGKYDTQLVEHFFQSLVNTSGMTLHIRQLNGRNSHHIIEATFKAFARALRQACEIDPRRQGMVPSTKGLLTRQ